MVFQQLAISILKHEQTWSAEQNSFDNVQFSICET